MHSSSCSAVDWPFGGFTLDGALWAILSQPILSEPDGGSVRGALGAASASPLKGQKIKLQSFISMCKDYTSVHDCKCSLPIFIIISIQIIINNK